MIKQHILLAFFFSNTCIYAQDLQYSDFKNRNFYVEEDEFLPLGYKIIREGNSQVEIVQDPENKLGSDFTKTSYEIIEWIDNCTYRLKYDKTKMQLSEYQQFLNDNNGVLTELLKIEGKCFFVKSTLNVNGEIQRIDSKMCLE